jgi:hypothetical protein
VSSKRPRSISVLVAIWIASVPAASAAFAGQTHCSSHVKLGCAHVHRDAAARPKVVDVVAKAVKEETATLQARVKTYGLATTYRFAYWIPGHTRKLTRAISVRADRGVVAAHLRVAGLNPNTGYRFRLLAADRNGKISGPQRTFTTGRSHAQSVSALIARRSMLWGAEIGTQFSGTQPPWDMTGVSDFQREVGKAPSVVPFNIPFEDCDQPSNCYWFGFPTQQMDAVRTYGAIPMLNWSSMSSPLIANEPAFTLANVINGGYDSYIRDFALGAKAWGHPFFLRFDWEMNSNWFPWAEAANGNSPGQSAAAWRHVHDIFTSVGATNVNWVWCPTVTNSNAAASLTEVYPGDQYVDWTCTDGYNWGTKAHGPHGWTTFDKVFSSTYEAITTKIAPTKPMMIGEVASSSFGGSKSGWIGNMFASLRSEYPNIRALLWYDESDGYDWPLENSPSGIAAFAQGVGSRSYQSNIYGSDANNTLTAALAP